MLGPAEMFRVDQSSHVGAECYIVYGDHQSSLIVPLPFRTQYKCGARGAGARCFVI